MNFMFHAADLILLQELEEHDEIIAIVSLCAGVWTEDASVADVAVGTSASVTPLSAQDAQLPVVTPMVLLVRVP